MSIVRKTAIIFSVMAIAMFAILWTVSVLTIKSNYERLEREGIEKDVQRAVGVFSLQIDNLNSYGTDWSMWDDTVRFVQDGNTEYIESNLMDATLANANINVMLYFDLSGHMVFGKAFDLKDNHEILVPQELENYISDTIMTGYDTEANTSGIVSLSETSLIVCVQPILDSSGGGPPAGTFVAGRFIDQDFIDNLSQTAQLSLVLYQLDNAQMPADFKSASEALSNNKLSVFTGTLDNDSVAGYTLLSDIHGTSVLLLRADAPRDIYREGLATLSYFYLALLIIGLLFIATFYLILRGMVLSRVTNLNSRVSEIAVSSDISKRIPESGHDEISCLAANINGMLSALEHSQKMQETTQELIDRILATIPNAVLVVGGDSRIILANRAFCDTFKRKQVEVIAKPISEIIPFEELLQSILKTRSGETSSITRELSYILNGRKVTFIADILQMEQGEVLLMLSDVTEERERQERLYLTDRLASVGEMAAGIAHELNNPLTGVIGLSQLLLHEEVSGDIKKDLEAINSEAQRAAVVVKNLLTFARKHTPMKQAVQINAIVEDVLRLRAYEHKVNDIRVITRFDNELPKVMADQFQLQQVFLNIILNAEQAMIESHKGGTLTITTERVDGNIRVSFSDNGPGISPENMRKLFSPFFTTKEVGKGTGLGLSICYGIVTNHGGRIYAESQSGKGATFVVELPISQQ